MTTLTKSLSAAAIVAGAAIAAPAAAQVAGIATTSPEIVIARSAARAAAYTQIGTTYDAQLKQINTLQQQTQTLIKSLDTNNDGQLTDAERTAKPAVITQIQGVERQINTLATPITLAQAYVLDQIAREYGAARQQVITAKNVQVILNPDAIQYAPPAADITNDIVTALNTRKPTATITVPAGWQPSQPILQLQQAVQQLIMAAAQQQAAAVQQAQPGATPAPAAPKPKGR